MLRWTQSLLQQNLLLLPSIENVAGEYILSGKHGLFAVSFPRFDGEQHVASCIIGHRLKARVPNINSTACYITCLLAAEETQAPEEILIFSPSCRDVILTIFPL